MAALGMVLLAAGLFAFAFGATRLLLRGTWLEPFTAEASFLAGPVYLVLALSCLGYRTPNVIPRGQVLAVVLAGVALSAAVCVREWPRLRALAAENRGRLLTILPPACFAAAVLMVYFPGNEWVSFTSLNNGEYLNYA